MHTRTRELSRPHGTHISSVPTHACTTYCILFVSSECAVDPSDALEEDCKFTDSAGVGGAGECKAGQYYIAKEKCLPRTLHATRGVELYSGVRENENESSESSPHDHILYAHMVCWDSFVMGSEGPQQLLHF